MGGAVNAEEKLSVEDALEGTDDRLETLERTGALLNPELELLGVIVMPHDKRTDLAGDTCEQVREVPTDKQIIPHAPRAQEHIRLAREVMQGAR